MLKALRILGTVALLGLPGLALAADAVEVVESLHAALLDTMKQGPALGFKGRQEKLGPALDERFDFPGIAKVVTGRHWQQLPEDKRLKFIQTFRNLSVATYADNFSGFGGEHFETLGHEARTNSELVRTNLVDGEGKRVSLNYVLTRSNDQWRIINVVAEGVSDLALKRSEYDGLIAKEGIDSLVAKLEAKVASYVASSK
jgi:phospholipid transport system substrate-binding protein